MQESTREALEIMLLTYTLNDIRDPGMDEYAVR